MNNIKERLIGAITVISEDEAKTIWRFIEKRHFSPNWNEIEEVVPDEFDLQMLHEAENDPECHDFIPASEAKKMMNDIIA